VLQDSLASRSARTLHAVGDSSILGHRLRLSKCWSENLADPGMDCVDCDGDRVSNAFREPLWHFRLGGPLIVRGRINSAPDRTRARREAAMHRIRDPSLPETPAGRSSGCGCTGLRRRGVCA
jgi:hypothetical protein